MKRALIVLAVALLPAALFAVPPGPWFPSQQFPGMRPPEAGPFYSAEILKIQSEMGQEKLGDLDVAAMVSLRERLSIAAQKDEYVKAISLHSLALPGLGQFETGNTGSGFGFLALDLATIAGTLLGVYYSLPSDVRFDHIDYFRDSFSSISDAWNGHSIVDYLPALGVLLGGVVVDQVVRHWAASDAANAATRNIDQGAVTFTPRIGVGAFGFELAY